MMYIRRNRPICEGEGSKQRLTLKKAHRVVRDSGSGEGGRVQQGALGGTEMISFRGSKREVEL
jgi:hypothetical protein